MTLAAYLETLDDLPEALAAHYVATEDGRFRLDAEGVEDVSALKSALERERARRRALSEGDRDSQLAHLRDRLRDAEAAREIVAAGGVPELLLPAVRPALAVTVGGDGDIALEVRDATGAPRFDADGAPLSVRAWIDQLRDDPVYGRAFDAPAARGTGSPTQGAAGGDGQVIALGDGETIGRHIAEIASGAMRVAG